MPAPMQACVGAVLLFVENGPVILPYHRLFCVVMLGENLLHNEDLVNASG